MTLKKIVDSDRVISNKTKNLRFENEIKKLNNFDAAYFRGKNYFDNDGTPNYLVFQPVHKYFEINSGRITSWESKGLSNEKNTSASSPHNDILRKLVHNNGRIELKL